MLSLLLLLCVSVCACVCVCVCTGKTNHYDVTPCCLWRHQCYDHVTYFRYTPLSLSLSLSLSLVDIKSGISAKTITWECYKNTTTNI